MTTPPAPGWYADPQSPALLRWWDGARWGAQTTPVPGAVAVAAPQPYQTPGEVPPVGIWRSPIDNRPIVNDMWTAVKVAFTKYAQFDGRASRSEFWYFVLAIALSYLVVTFLLFFTVIIPVAGILTGSLFMALVFGVLVPQLAAVVRRLRDAGWAWPWVFLGAVPGGSIFLIVVCCQPSKYP
ncbi:DUF805 domain-containing protein [Microbacterium sp.]|uniref:DUF805 domain-containing protein n=1 Tax=Microbacterium sp. TaxID=51671 RepID=UPI003A836DD1